LTPLGKAMERAARIQRKIIMATDNQISVVITDRNVTDNPSLAKAMSPL